MLILALGCVGRAPTLTEVTILPAAPNTTDDLVGTVVGDTSDPDGDDVTLQYAWSVDGAARDDLTDAVVPASVTTKGETWEVVITPTDGELEGTSRAAKVTVANSIPAVTLSLSPTMPTAADEITVEATSTDLDRDAVTVAWEWRVDGTLAAYAEAVLAAGSTRRGETWEVTATPSDGEEAGEPASLAFTVVNAVPYLDAVNVSPAAATVETTLDARFQGAGDADGDVVFIYASWLVDGAEVASEDVDPAGVTHLSGVFTRGQSISVVAMPNDGSEFGLPVTSAALVIGDSPPSLTGARITPAPVIVGQEVACEGIGWFDADGDPPGWDTMWTVNDLAVSIEPTLAPEGWGSGDTIGCTLTPYDGELDGVAVSAQVVVP